jgi:hypothetical protein
VSLPSLPVLWDHILRHYGDRHEITVDALLQSLQAEKHAIERWEVVELFKDWQAAKYCDLTYGRRNRKSRIWLHKKPKEMPSPPGAEEQTVPLSIPTKRYDLPLSDGRFAILEFPADLKVGEVEKIGTFLTFFASNGPTSP